MNRTNLLNDRKFLIKYITSYSILVIIILIMGLYMYKIGIDDARSNLFKQSYIILSQSVLNMDTAFRSMETLSMQIADNSNIIKLEKMQTTDNPFYLSAKEGMNFLTSFGPSETLLPISDYYIYLPHTDYVLSSSYLNRTDLYYRLNKHYNTQYYSEWLSVLNRDDSCFSFYNTQKFSPYSSSPYLYLVPFKKYTIQKNLTGKICFEIDGVKLHNLFSDLPFFERGFLYVIDKDSQPSFSITDEKTPSLSEETIQTVLSSIDETPYFSSVNVGKEKMLITSITSSYNEWTYYLFQPEELVFQSLISYHKIYSFITLGASIISFLVILVLSKRNLVPFIKIRTQLEDTLKEHSSLQQTLFIQKQLIFESYIARLITGQIHNMNELHYISDYLNICTQNRNFCVLYITAYYIDTTNHLSNEILLSSEQEEYHHILRQEFREAFGWDILIHDTDTLSNSFALLVGDDDTLSLEDATALHAGQFLALQEKITKNYPFYLFCGMGNRNRDLTHIWKSYQQARQAVAHASSKAPFQPYKKLHKSWNGYYYPLEFAQKLTEFITSGNEKQVQEFLHLIEYENLLERTLTPLMKQLLFSDIRNTLLKIRFSITTEITNSPESETLLEQIDANLENSELEYQTLSDTALWMTSFYKPKQQEGNQLIRTIQEYIKNNYVDSSLCLNKISEQFGISESYFSYLFKAETKTNFSEYLEKLRMEQALVLLQTTSIPVSNLYLEVGYNNANSFRRAFKKVHGVSPKAIRDSAKKQL
ncbi:MAG: helix-turn-helix domain-containing protein [Lachnospiraceae bacterium]|nr:helix-turn-helix domain-containing protein [Lachnospiraceae bacterium]